MKLYRVEDKYCCTGQEFYELQRRLDAVLRVDGNGDGGEGYCVDSLYFDDFADTCLADVSEGMIIGGNIEYAFITMYRISSNWK